MFQQNIINIMIHIKEDVCLWISIFDLINNSVTSSMEREIKKHSNENHRKTVIKSGKYS